VSATIKRGEDSTFNGQTYPSYDVGNFTTAVNF